MMMMSNEELSVEIMAYAETERYIYEEATLSEMIELKKEQLDRANAIYTELLRRNCARTSNKQLAIVAIAGMESAMFFRFPVNLKFDDTRLELESLDLQEGCVRFDLITINDRDYVIRFKDESKLF